MRKSEAIKIATFDLETDPFEYGATIEPFAAGFFDGVNYADFWGDDCIDQIAAYFNSLPDPLHIYAHNGGKFDFMFLLYAGLLENPVKIINGRIVSAKMGKHTLRDSYALLPVPLAAYAKDKINYDWFKRHRREKYRNEILHYLAKDCEYLWDFVTAFHARFGANLTTASTAYKQLKQFSPQENTRETFDARLREFYFGGRVECIETGIIEAPLKVYDVNSMYPYTMREFNHPYGSVTITTDEQPDQGGFLKSRPQAVYFAHILAISNGALPVRKKDGGLDFPAHSMPLEFAACSHEIQAALELDLLKIIEWRSIEVFPFNQRFENFVDTFIADKIAAKESGDKTTELFAKLMLNSCYGKFGQNPREYHDYCIIEDATKPPAFCISRDGAWVDEKGRAWELYADYGTNAIWRTPAPSFRFNNVATAASITSAARSVLLKALTKAVRPVYCDTDSIICEALPLETHNSKLGAWKLEAEGNRIAIAGKKLYALTMNDKTVKVASKGVKLDACEIEAVAEDANVGYKKESPSMGLKGIRYTERTITKRV